MCRRRLRPEKVHRELSIVGIGSGERAADVGHGEDCRYARLARLSQPDVIGAQRAAVGARVTPQRVEAVDVDLCRSARRPQEQRCQEQEFYGKRCVHEAKLPPANPDGKDALAEPDKGASEADRVGTSLAREPAEERSNLHLAYENGFGKGDIEVYLELAVEVLRGLAYGLAVDKKLAAYAEEGRTEGEPQRFERIAQQVLLPRKSICEGAAAVNIQHGDVFRRQWDDPVANADDDALLPGWRGNLQPAQEFLEGWRLLPAKPVAELAVFVQRTRYRFVGKRFEDIVDA